MCGRGKLILEHLYHPDRLNYPLKRSGDNGEGKWQRLTWEQALDEIAAKLKAIKEQCGPESLALTNGTYRTYSWARTRFFSLFGSPNLTGANHICMCPSHTVEWSTYGFMAHEDIRHTACVVVWGLQPSQSTLIPGWRELVDAKKRGARGITRYLLPLIMQPSPMLRCNIGLRT
jgi:anaerobic selenocysteine-containing dehydrogenase